MGVRLFVEALDYAPDTLTWRERHVLSVFAENARDATRTCWPGVEDNETFIRRCRLSRTGRYEVIKALIAKGALELVRHGHRGSKAAYRVMEMAPADAVLPAPQEAPDAEPPAESVPETGTQSEGKRPGLTEKGSRFGGESVPQTGTPSPQSPQGSPQSDARVVAAVVEELAAASQRTIDEEWAGRVAKQILGSARGDVASPVDYVVKAIRTAAKADGVARFLPTPTPPSARDLPDEAPPLLPVPEPPAETAPCGHDWPAWDADGCFLCAKERAQGPAESAQEPPEAPRPDLTVHHGQQRPSARDIGQAPLLTTVPGDAAEETARPRTPAEWAAFARAGLPTGTDNT